MISRTTVRGFGKAPSKHEKSYSITDRAQGVIASDLGRHVGARGGTVSAWYATIRFRTVLQSQRRLSLFPVPQDRRPVAAVRFDAVGPGVRKSELTQTHIDSTLVNGDGALVPVYFVVILLLTGLIVPIAACQMLFVVSGSYVRRLAWEGSARRAAARCNRAWVQHGSARS